MSDPQQDDILRGENLDFATGEGQTPGPVPNETTGVRPETAPLAGPSIPEQRPPSPHINQLNREVVGRENRIDTIDTEKAQQELAAHTPLKGEEKIPEKDRPFFRRQIHRIKNLVKNYASNFNPKGKGAEYFLGTVINIAATKAAIALAIPTFGTSLMVKAAITAGASLGSHAVGRGIYHLKHRRLEKMHADNPTLLAEKTLELQQNHEKGTRRIRNFFSGMAAGAVLGGGYEMIAFANPELGLPTFSGSGLAQALTEKGAGFAQKIGEANVPFVADTTVGNALGGAGEKLGQLGGKLGELRDNFGTTGVGEKLANVDDGLGTVKKAVIGEDQRLATMSGDASDTTVIHEPGLVDKGVGFAADKFDAAKDTLVGDDKTVTIADREGAHTYTSLDKPGLVGNARAAIEERLPDNFDGVGGAVQHKIEGAQGIGGNIGSFFSRIRDRITGLFGTPENPPPDSIATPPSEDILPPVDKAVADKAINNHFDKIADAGENLSEPPPADIARIEVTDKPMNLPEDQGHIANRDPKAVIAAAAGITAASAAAAVAIDKAGRKAIG